MHSAVKSALVCYTGSFNDQFSPPDDDDVTPRGLHSCFVFKPWRQDWNEMSLLFPFVNMAVGIHLKTLVKQLRGMTQAG